MSFATRKGSAKIVFKVNTEITSFIIHFQLILALSIMITGEETRCRDKEDSKNWE